MRLLVRALVVVLLALRSVPALAQGEALAALLPTELSVGLGGGGEWSPGRSLVAVNLGLSKVWVRDGDSRRQPIADGHRAGVYRRGARAMTRRLTS